ncbi:MAG: hypothetical protein IKA32_00620, partial [Lentisphaeria bacterium]|nr:hypothetical protein [Lentisphaeria bacterium]
EILTRDTYKVLTEAKAAIVNSGTATLEAALIGCPQTAVYYIAVYRIIVGNFGTAFIVFKFCRIAFFCIKADRYRTVFHNRNNLTHDAFVTYSRNFFSVGRTRNTGADIVGITHPAGKGSGIDLFKRGVEDFCSLSLKFVKEHPVAVSADTLSTLDIHIDLSGERGRKGDGILLPLVSQRCFI